MAPAPPNPRAEMALRTVDGMAAFAKARELVGPATVLFATGVGGRDLLVLDQSALVANVKVPPWAVRKILRARDSFVCGS